MYLVRSVNAANLSEVDLRQQLLRHFDKPFVMEAEESDNLLERCESGFERDVFGELASRGYNVMPQVKTGAYRIDLVVEGADDRRLAVECDGDEFHGPERWQQDITRQRVLERAGWIFWRCFASTWTLRRAEMIEELIEQLTLLGISPLGASEAAPRFVEKRVWKRDREKDDVPEVARVIETALGASGGV